MNRRRRRSAFTLVEVLLVLAILVILGAMVGVGVIQMKKAADKRAARAQVGMFESAINLYRLDVGQFPESLEDLRVAPQLKNPDKWNGPYLQKEIPADPWQNHYQYEAQGDDFRVWSSGPDGADGSGDDIDNKKS
jgi:general secretion pathway protein G